MYSEDLIRVCKIQNGFLVEVKEPRKESKKGECMPCCEEFKAYSVKTADEAAKMVAKMLPGTVGETTEDEFGDAFDEASEINDAMDEEMENA